MVSERTGCSCDWHKGAFCPNGFPRYTLSSFDDQRASRKVVDYRTYLNGRLHSSVSATLMSSSCWHRELSYGLVEFVLELDGYFTHQ